MLSAPPREPDVESALRALVAGRPVLLGDDEASGPAHIVTGAEHLRSETLAVMAEHGGLVCLALTPERLDGLGLSRAARPGAGGRALSTSIDASDDLTDSWSIRGRARTMRIASAPKARAEHVISPGHVLPMQSDTASLAHPIDVATAAAAAVGLTAAIVVSPLRTGSPMLTHLPHLDASAAAAFVAAGRAPSATAGLPTTHGDFVVSAYDESPDGRVLLTLVLGEPGARGASVGVHVGCVLGHAFGSLACDCAASLDADLQRLRDRGAGVLLYAKQDGAPAVCPDGATPPELFPRLAAALHHLGLSDVRLTRGDAGLAAALAACETALAPTSHARWASDGALRIGP